ncbi:MAG: glycosyltransferase family 2 protein [Alphaproteobacteria bacterium]
MPEQINEAKDPPVLSLVIPMFNEEDGLDILFDRLCPVLDGIGEPYEILCVDDGSRDGTLAALAKIQDRVPQLVIAELSRNFGKESALSAGLDIARGQAVIPFDADLQDPPEVIPDLVAKWRDGFDVVLARRTDRRAEGAMKRFTAWAFYRTHNVLAEHPIPNNVGDFRLMDRRVVDVLTRLPERRRFMKGLFAWVGFKTAIVDFERASRAAGDTKWNYWKLWNFALEGITSFSSLPLRFWSYIGAAVAAISFLYAAFIVLFTLFAGIDVPGYASLLVIVLFLGGLQLLSLGLLGEYVGRIYAEVKGRPLYVLRRVHRSVDAENRSSDA